MDVNSAWVGMDVDVYECLFNEDGDSPLEHFIKFRSYAETPAKWFLFIAPAFIHKTNAYTLHQPRSATRAATVVKYERRSLATAPKMCNEFNYVLKPGIRASIWR